MIQMLMTSLAIDIVRLLLAMFYHVTINLHLVPLIGYGPPRA